MTGNVVISEVDALMYVVLSNAEKLVRYGELVGTTECITLQTRCRTIRSCYKRVKLYLYLHYSNSFIFTLEELTSG
jgi:hypothetical protein